MNLKNEKQLLYCLVILVTGWICTNSCKKVDNRIDYVYSLPSIAIINKTTYTVGDTMQITGKLFAASGTLKIHIGDADATIISQHVDTLAQYHEKREIVDVVRLLISEQMGVGDKIPFTITTNGHTISGPELAIRRFAKPSGKTDTTLWVDNFAGWEPANPRDYQFNGQQLPIYVGSSVAANGNIVFFNALGIFQVDKNGVKPLLTKGKVFTEDGQTFTVLWFLGSTISADGKSLYFSAEVKDAASDPDKYYVYRICKMDIAGSKIETLNRTNLPNIPPSGGITDQAPYEGTASSLKLVALNLKMDYNSNLYFVNYYCSKAVSSSRVMKSWHDNLLGPSDFSSRTAGMNICQYQPKGQIRSIAKPNNFNTTYIPGYTSGRTADYLLSPDGIYMYLENVKNYSNWYDKRTLVQYNLRTEEPELLSNTGNSEYRFFSYDTAAATRIPKLPYQQAGFDFRITNAFMGTWGITRISALALEDGTMLCGELKSLVAVNLASRTFYLYAGTEIGITYGSYPFRDQNKETGKAKLVDFFKIGSSMAFCGYDSKGAIYYSGGNGTSNTPPTKLSFYKLYSRQ